MDILTVAQAAEFLQVHEETLRPMVAKGDIPSAKVRGQYRLIKEDLVAWLRSQYATKPKTTDAESCLTNDQAPAIGGSVSREYDRLLGLKTSSPRKPLRTS